MGKIRERMRRDLTLAGYAPSMQDHCLGAAARFVRRFRPPPAQMGQEHLRTRVSELGASGMDASDTRRAR
ncbi:hypothetical protein [Sorangium sp. So ce1182]|uniref:hypothetical protein n=1 Tax=Sorangium sp. So ce1182 TaxID=3133334 RepID=UPI003F62D917